MYQRKLSKVSIFKRQTIVMKIRGQETYFSDHFAVILFFQCCPLEETSFLGRVARFATYHSRPQISLISSILLAPVLVPSWIES